MIYTSIHYFSVSLHECDNEIINVQLGVRTIFHIFDVILVVILFHSITHIVRCDANETDAITQPLVEVWAQHTHNNKNNNNNNA